MLNQYTDEDAGFEQQLELFEMVRKRSGCLPIIIDGEELRQNPAKVVTAYFTAIGLDPNLNSLNWREGSRVDWIGREDWHQQAIKSTTFLPNSKVIDLEKYPPRVRKTVESCLPIYEYMLSFSLHKRLVNSQTSF